jgi:hypothetical protein
MRAFLKFKFVCVWLGKNNRPRPPQRISLPLAPAARTRSTSILGALCGEFREGERIITWVKVREIQGHLAYTQSMPQLLSYDNTLAGALLANSILKPNKGANFVQKLPFVPEARLQAHMCE